MGGKAGRLTGWNGRMVMLVCCLAGYFAEMTWLKSLGWDPLAEMLYWDPLEQLDASGGSGGAQVLFWERLNRGGSEGCWVCLKC